MMQGGRENGTRRSYLGLHLGLPDRSMSKSELALMHLNPITSSPPSLTDSQYLDNDIIGLGLASSLCNSDRVLRYPRCTHTIRLSAFHFKGGCISTSLNISISTADSDSKILSSTKPPCTASLETTSVLSVFPAYYIFLPEIETMYKTNYELYVRQL